MDELGAVDFMVVKDVLHVRLRDHVVVPFKGSQSDFEVTLLL